MIAPVAFELYEYLSNFPEFKNLFPIPNTQIPILKMKILSENNPAPKSKYFEFDIDQLSTKKLRELEKYVMDCLQKNMEKKAQNINNLIQLKNEQTSSIINSSHNQSEIDTNKKLDIENDNFSNTSDDDESESSSLSSLK